MSETVLELVEVSKIFNDHSSNRLTIFQNMNLKIKNSELVGIIAPSGTGKTSLLNISGLLMSECLSSNLNSSMSMSLIFLPVFITFCWPL